MDFYWIFLSLFIFGVLIIYAIGRPILTHYLWKKDQKLLESFQEEILSKIDISREGQLLLVKFAAKCKEYKTSVDEDLYFQLEEFIDNFCYLSEQFANEPAALMKLEELYENIISTISVKYTILSNDLSDLSNIDEFRKFWTNLFATFKSEKVYEHLNDNYLAILKKVLYDVFINHLKSVEIENSLDLIKLLDIFKSDEDLNYDFYKEWLSKITLEEKYLQIITAEINSLKKKGRVEDMASYYKLGHPENIKFLIRICIDKYILEEFKDRFNEKEQKADFLAAYHLRFRELTN